MNVEEFYDKFAHSYDETVSSKKIDSKLMRETHDLFKRQNVSNGSILDVGCGTGMLSETLGKSFDYTGIDLSSGMLEIATKRGYMTHKGDILKILQTLPSNSFDHVVCVSVLYWVENAQEIIEEMVRISKKTVTITLEKVSPIKEGHEKVIGETKIFDHSDIKISNLTEDYEFSAWTSPSVGMRVFARMVFMRKV